MNNLHIINDRFPSKRVLSELITGFRYYDISADRAYEGKDSKSNYLVFLLEGELLVSYNEFINNKVTPCHFYLIPKSSDFVVKSLSWCNIIVLAFESLKDIYDNAVFQSYWKIASQNKHTFSPLPIHYVLNDYLYLSLRYMRNKINDSKMDSLKTQELFLLIKSLYTKDEVANLLHPILGRSLNFKEKVLQHYQYANNVEELAKALEMGRTNFDIKFKKEFGIPPLRWMLREKAKRVRFSMAESDATLSDIMEKYNFSSPTHLNRFCKQQFGCSPTELIKRLNKLD